MAINQSAVSDDVLRKSSKSFSTKSSIREAYRAEKMAKNSQNIGQSFRDRTALEAFQSATYFSFYIKLPWVTFFWVDRY